MRPIGYLYKRIAKRPDWLAAPRVYDVYSLSGCISEPFADYVNFWKHNGFWLFDSPAVIEQLAAEHNLDLRGLKLFYYEAFEQEFDEEKDGWRPFDPEKSFETNVEPPETKALEGYDVTCFFAGTTPECSPLSCNGRAVELGTNEHCLFGTLDEAKRAIETGAIRECEPGPYRIIAVYSVP